MSNLPDLPPELQSAATAASSGKKRFLIIGPPGSGKSVLTSTLPGTTLSYLLDPNAIESLRGKGREHIAVWEAPQDQRSFALMTLKSSAPNYIPQGRRQEEPKKYAAWEETFQRHLESGVLSKFDNVGLDGLTSLQYSMMDMIAYLNNRSGRMPEQDDYGPVIHTFMMIWQTMTELPNKSIFCTAHEEIFKDERSGIITYAPLLYGKMKGRLPMLFTDILRCEVEDGRYLLHTISDSRHRYVRCSFRGVPPVIDWTIENWDKTDPRTVGLGGLLAGKYKAK